MSELLKRKYIDFAFRWSIILKGIDAIIEIVASFVVLFVTQDFVLHAVSLITHEELTEDPKDFISNYLLGAAQNFSVGAQMFAFIYLLSHGVIKLLLIAGLLKKKLWAYPASLVVFSLFIVYQIYRYTYTQSVWLIILTLFDLIVLWLIWREYRYIKKKNSSVL
jgi:uncharacterized membrane protein